MKLIPSLKKVLFELQKLPGVGPRSAQRLAHYLMKTDSTSVKALSKALVDLKNKLKKCEQCFNFTEETLCDICKDPHREISILCVVEQAFDVSRVENCGAFRGYYHVLHGVISPLHRIHPNHLTLEQLQERIQKSNIKELILAIDSDLEGDTTALFILKMLQDTEIKITRLAHGIPFGGNLEFVDDKTLTQAITNRSSL